MGAALMLGFDRKRTYSNDSKDRPVAAGATANVEGRVLVGSIESGVEVVSYSAGGSTTENIVGFLVNTGLNGNVRVVIENITVPNTGSATETFTLSHGNLVSSTLRILNNTSAADLVAGSPASGNSLYSVTNSTGVVIVGSSIAGNSLTAFYKYTLTEMEVQTLLHSRPINQGGSTFFGVVSVLRGQGEIYTAQWDTTVDFSTATLVYTGANGIMNKTNTNTLVGRVVSRPTATDPYVGIAFNLA
jgi:hypothetical protein